MRAFVTGGTGFVGSHLVEALHARGYEEVRALVRSAPKWLDGMPVTFVRGDLAHTDALREAMEGVDIVYHVAGMTRAPDRAALDRANVDGTLRVLEDAEAAGVRKVLVTSSLAAVGPSGSTPLNEDAPLQPISNYGRSKAEMERRIAMRTDGPAVVVVRPPVVYGPREADIYTMIRTAGRQRVFPIVGEGRTPQLDLVHVRDLVQGMVAAAESEATAGQTYFLGGARSYAWREIKDTIAQALGHAVLQIHVPPLLVRPVGSAVEGVGRLFGRYPPLNREKAREAVESWLISSDKARRDFGYEPVIGLAEGMQETVNWYRAHNWL
jgi:nucleoside-diphosphate-sugar epimerase